MQPRDWDEVIDPSNWPSNIRVGKDTVLTGQRAFKQYASERSPGLIIGDDCFMQDVHFSIGREGQVRIGNLCSFTNAILLCDLEISIGNRVVIGWNATIVDADFHPLAAAERIRDTIAISPLGNRNDRPPFSRDRIEIEDDVFIGPRATILKGVRLGSGAWIEPGSVVLKDVPTGARVLGNPAVVVDDA
jgi:acetyltransferase-like isoleucine patch superfamily enzyme